MSKELVKFEIAVTPETATDVEKVLQERGWNPAEGLQILLGMGMGAARGERARLDADARERMVARLKEVEGSLAVLRSRMFEMEKANEAWDLSTGAIRQQNIGFQGLIERQKEELEQLKAENVRLRAGLLADQVIQSSSESQSTIKSSPESKLRRRWNRIRGR